MIATLSDWIVKGMMLTWVLMLALGIEDRMRPRRARVAGLSRKPFAPYCCGAFDGDDGAPCRKCGSPSESHPTRPAHAGVHVDAATIHEAWLRRQIAHLAVAREVHVEQRIAGSWNANEWAAWIDTPTFDGARVKALGKTRLWALRMLMAESRKLGGTWTALAASEHAS